MNTRNELVSKAPKSQKSARKRTRIACLRCRARKVRCDSTGSGVACTNCKLDAVDCPVDTVRARQRGQSSAARGEEGSDAPLVHSNSQQKLPATGKHSPSNKLDSPAGSEASGQISDIYTEDLPRFVRPFPTEPESPLRAFLYSKGVLSAPPLRLRKALWLAYLRSIHPSLPVVQVRHVSALMLGDEASNPTFSLLLFHAIMFAGMHTVDMQYLIDAGYTSRKSCIHHCFEIVKLLYDFDYESDRTCLIQCLLIMTLWYRSPDDDKDPWHYVLLAISLAKKMGLHRQSGTSTVLNEERSLLRRLWWCCVMRDYMIAYGMSRPVHIHLSGSDATMLSIDDFDDQDLAEGLSMTTGYPVEEDKSEGRSLAAIFVKLINLCKIVHDYLEVEDQNGLQLASATNAYAPPTCNVSGYSRLQKVDRELVAWYDDLRKDPVASIVAVQDRNQTALCYVQHCGLLHMLYHTAVMTVHRKHKLPADQDLGSEELQALMAKSRERVRAAAHEVIIICEIFRQRDLLRGLPMPFMSCLLITGIVTLVEIKSAGDTPHKDSVGALSMLWGIMKQLGSQVTYIDWSSQVLEAACQAAKIPIAVSADKDHDNTDVGDYDEALRAQAPTSTSSGLVNVPMNYQNASHGDVPMNFVFTPPQEPDIGFPSLPWMEPSEDFTFLLPSPGNEDALFDIDFNFLEHTTSHERTFLFNEPNADMQYGFTGFTPSADFMVVDQSPRPVFGI